MTAAAEQPSGRRFSFAHLVLVVPWIALVIAAWTPIRDNSFLWHIRAGTLQADAGRVLEADPFSFTKGGEHWRTQSWLVELAYAQAETWSNGLGFVPPMLLAVSTVTFIALGLIAFRSSDSLGVTALVLILSVGIMIPFLVPRPVLFSMALFGLLILAWDSPTLRWSIPFLVWIWASVHASFALGLIFIGLSILAARQWKWLPVAIVSGLATLLTAHGLGVIEMLLGFARARETLALISEWRPPSLSAPTFLPFLAGLGLIVWGVIAKRVPGRMLLVAAPFAALGFTSLRSVPPAWIALVSFIAMGGSFMGSGVRRFSRMSAIVFALVVGFLPFFLKGEGRLDEERFPVAAARRLDHVRTFHDDRTGGYLIWRQGPGFEVYVDDRAELYGELLREFTEVRDAEIPFQPVFEDWGITQILMPRDTDVVAEVIEFGWETVYQDRHFVVLTGPSGAPSPETGHAGSPRL